MPIILGILDFSTIKNELFPVVAAVFSKTSSLAIKIRGLEAFRILCGAPIIHRSDTGDGLDGAGSRAQPIKTHSAAILDKYTVQEKVVPLLKAIKTKEPAVIMAALPVFTQIGKMVDADFLAMDVLPLIWSFSLGPLLNLQQFQAYMTLIKALSSRIEQEQTRKLTELSSNPNSTTELSESADLMGISKINGAFDSSGTGDVGLSDFERLVLGRTAPEEKNIPATSARPGPQRAQTAHSEAPVFAWSTLAPSLGSHPGSRAITPDQTLNSFIPLDPSPKSQASWSNPALNSSNTLSSARSTLTPLHHTLTPLQPTMASLQPTLAPLQATLTSPWTFESTTSSTMAPANIIQSPASFSVPPLQTAPSPFSAFSIAPPPRHPVLSNGQINHGQGLGAPGKGGNTTKQKTGLDAFESLL